jgi:hypothetical protein
MQQTRSCRLTDSCPVCQTSTSTWLLSPTSPYQLLSAQLAAVLAAYATAFPAHQTAVDVVDVVAGSGAAGAV